jgi:hypothetical protein
MAARDDSVGAVLDRALTWFVTGPLGHLVAGVLDWVEMLVRWQLHRLAKRRGGRAA